MNDMNIHTIADLQRYVNCMGCPSCQFEAPVKFMNMDWKLYRLNRCLPLKTTGKSLFIKIWIDMGREVKFIFLHVKILLYH